MAREAEIRLTGTSYVVLGMLDWIGPSTPYRLQRVLEGSVEDFFPIPHTSFYVEPTRLAKGGYLKETRERGGRRRKTYDLTAKGRKALSDWVEEPLTEYGQFRFPGMLKIFFGADPSAFARDQARHHRELAERFEGYRTDIEQRGVDVPEGRRLVLDTGIDLHRWWAERWQHVADHTE